MIGKFLTTDERQELIKLHKRTRDSRISDRMKAILLLDGGWRYERVAEALFLDDQTIRNYYGIYADSGVKGLSKFHYMGQSCRLSETQLAELIVYLDAVTHLNVDSIVLHVRREYGIKYAPKGMTSLIKRLGFEYKKPKLVPGSPDAALQQKFVEQYEAIKQNLSPSDEIVFLDSVHPQHNVKSGYGWILKDTVKHLPTNTGRARLNITGALNVQKLDVTMRQSTKNVNAYAVADILLDLMAKYPVAKNIYVILDNAQYNRAKLISVFKYTKIKLLFLPPYSPNLNLIERLWRFFHSKVTRFKHYKTFADFQTACKNFFDNIGQYKDQLKSLLIDNFNIISKPSSNFISA